MLHENEELAEDEINDKIVEKVDELKLGLSDDKLHYIGDFLS